MGRPCVYARDQRQWSGPNLRLPSICSRRIAGRSDRSYTLLPLRASCMSTDALASNSWPTRRASRSQRVGATRDGSSTMWPKPRRPLQQKKPCAGSASSMRSRRGSAVGYLPTCRAQDVLQANHRRTESLARCTAPPGLRPQTLAEAIRYALSRWHGLTRFLNDGRVELDTNPVERAIRPVTPRPQEAPFCRQRRWWTSLGGRLLAHHDVQIERRRAPRLAAGRPAADDRRIRRQPPR